ncbi:MAG: alkene reductase [Planctomycetota bacterium]
MPTTTDALFTPHTLGLLQLPNRIVMAPMTRCRATLPGEVPNDLMATYYAQRSTAGLIISEATHVCPGGLGFHGMPGIYTDAQRDGWQRVTDAVHQAGGRIFAQLFHAGRATHPDLLPEDAKPRSPVGPSAISIPDGVIHTPNGKQPIPTPHALTVDEIQQLVADFRHAAEVAKAAGFDGVQLHGANGYLIDSFIRDGANHRTDDYGGSVANRLRFPLQILDQLAEVFGHDRVGIRLLALANPNAVSDSAPLDHFPEIFKALDAQGLGHLELCGTPWMPDQQDRLNALARQHFSRTLIFNNGYSAELAQNALAENRANLISFAKPFIANPDLPERFRQGAPLNDTAGDDTLYNVEAGPRGYTDYPALAEASSA